MDLSKLPNFSDTPAPPPPITPASDPSPHRPAPPGDPTPDPVYPIQYRPGSGSAPSADIWLGVGLGAFLLFLFPTFVQWVASVVFHTNFPYQLPLDQTTGQPIPYPQLVSFKADLGTTAMAGILILDGVVLLIRRLPVMTAAIALTVAATAYNLGWCVWSLFKAYPTPVGCVIAFLIGGMTVFTQWSTLRSLRRR